ncbi:MAG: hypothetical protein Q9227_007694 [Pyrenula ochraceoflavens]
MSNLPKPSSVSNLTLRLRANTGSGVHQDDSSGSVAFASGSQSSQNAITDTEALVNLNAQSSDIASDSEKARLDSIRYHQERKPGDSKAPTWCDVTEDWSQAAEDAYPPLQETVKTEPEPDHQSGWETVERLRNTLPFSQATKEDKPEEIVMPADASMQATQDFNSHREQQTTNANDVPTSNWEQERSHFELSSDAEKAFQQLSNETDEVKAKREAEMIEKATHLSIVEQRDQLYVSGARKGKGLTMQEEVGRRISAEIPRTVDPMADTAIYIDPPPQQPGQDPVSYQKVCRHFQAPHEVQSKHIRALGSQKIEDMFAATAQFRMKRRLTKGGCMISQGPNIKYHLDWRIPVDGDEALVLLEGLTCTTGVLDWFKAMHHFNIPGTYVHGEDDVELCATSKARTDEIQGEKTIGSASSVHQQTPIVKQNDDVIQFAQPNTSTPAGNTDAKPQPREKHEGASSSEKEQKSEPVDRVLNWDGNLPRPPSPTTEHPAKPSSKNSRKAAEAQKAQQGEPDKFAETSFPPQEEYSQIRHRSAIERLLHAACGGDPRLDSAPKVWTYFAVAKYFDCATNPKINSWITVWLFDYDNANFIQANPEISYRIGMDIKSDFLTQTAFSILAAEKALATLAYTVSNSWGPAPVSLHRSRTEYLDDDEKNRIDHAADRFLHRIPPLFESLVDDRMAWLERCLQFQALRSHKRDFPGDSQLVDDLILILQHWVRTRLLHIQARNYGTEVGALENKWESVTKFYPLRKPLHEIYNDMPLQARLLTRTFWIALESEQLNEHQDSTFVDLLGQGHPEIGSVGSPNFRKIQAHLNNRPVKHFPTRFEVHQAVQSFNNRKVEREDQAHWSHAPAEWWSQGPTEAENTDHGETEDGASNDTTSPLLGHPPSNQSYDAKASFIPKGWFRRPWTSDTGPNTPGYATAELAPFVDPPSNTRIPSNVRFSLDTFLIEVKQLLIHIINPLLRPQHVWQGATFRLPTALIDTLYCLDEDEFKYLPLWAGGNDDGETGAVFDEAEVPFLETGGFAPGRGIHSAASDASSDKMSDDSFSDVASTAQGTTYRASHRATDGTLSENDADEVATEVGNMDDIWNDVRIQTTDFGRKGRGKMVELTAGSGSESVVMVDGPLATTATDDTQGGSGPPQLDGVNANGTSQFGKTTLYNTDRGSASAFMPGENHTTGSASVVDPVHYVDEAMDLQPEMEQDDDDDDDDDNESEDTARGDDGDAVMDDDEDEENFEHMELSDEEMGFEEI